jgi:hypothetical protein
MTLHLKPRRHGISVRFLKEFHRGAGALGATVVGNSQRSLENLATNLVECGMSFAYTSASSAGVVAPMEAAMDADIERDTVVLGAASAHDFMVLGLNAVACMIDMFGFADPAHASGAADAVRAGTDQLNGLRR